MSIYNNSIKNLSVFYRGNFIAKGYAQNHIVFDGELVTLTIVPSEQDATVQFTTTDAKIINENSITVRKGTVVDYTVSKEHYRTITGTITVQTTSSLSIQMSQNKVLNVEDYNYTTNSNNNVTLTEYIGSDTDVTIPEIIIL